MKWIFGFLLFLLLPLLGESQSNPLSRIVLEDDSLRKIANDPAHQVQIIYTRIDRDQQNKAHFTTYSYGLDSTQYFYPASTVKMPVAALALEKLNQLSIRGLDRGDRLLTGAATAPQTAVTADSSASNGQPTMAHYIKKIFLVSDNDAYNRLYEFLGQRYLNERLHAKGYDRTRIIHRLSVSGYDTLGNRLTNPVSLYEADQLLYHQGEVYSAFYPRLDLRNQVRGQGFIDSQGELIAGVPFDFRYKNYASLTDLHDMLLAILFPQDIPKRARFDLTEADYRFLYRYMYQYPREVDDPAYPHLANWDAYVKFLYFGSEKGRQTGPVRSLNKVGDAYGFLTDVAYIFDPKTGTEFVVAANIHVNANQIFNDGVYEYQEVGFPFMQRLGRLIYQYDAQRPRRRRADLSRFVPK